MKYSKIKNIVLAIIPVLVFFLYQNIQVSMLLNANFTFNRLPITLFNILVPCAIGVIAFFAMAYVYRNRDSLVFVSLFCGALLVNLLYMAYILGLFGLRMNRLNMSSASQVAYVLMGAYSAGFWVSLVSYIRGKRKRNIAQ